MNITDRLRARHQTAYIRLNPRNCIACWECIASCPKDVLGKIDFLGHRHAKIKNGNACIGCKKCLRACQHNAIATAPPASALGSPR